MTITQGARTRLTVAKEASFGVLPTSPSFQELEFRTHSLGLTKAVIPNDEILRSRMETGLRHGNRVVGGDVSVLMRRGAYDELLESLMFGNFATDDEITPNVTPQYLTFQDEARDIGRFRQFSGCLVNSASFTIAPDQSVQATFGIVGRDMAQTSSTLGSPTESAGYEPFDSFNGLILEGGVASGDAICNVSQVQFTITNNISPAHVILCEDNVGVAANMQYGICVIEGTLSVYYDTSSVDLINKFLNETETSLSITVDDATGTNGYTFYMQTIKYTGANVPVSGMEGRIVELPFRAFKDPDGTAAAIKITRTA